MTQVMYASAENMLERFGVAEMADLVGIDSWNPDIDQTPDEYTDSSIIRRALEDVSADIDSRLAVAYALPLADGTYPFLVAVACDLARRRLYDNEVPEAVSNRARNAGQRLQQLVAGRRDLVDSDGERVARRPTGKVQEAAATDGSTPPNRRQDAAEIRRYF